MRSLALVALLTCALATLGAQERRGFSVRIVEPENQSVVIGKTTIRADVSIKNNAWIDRVEFQVGDEVIFVDREAPFECVHDFGEEARSWIIRATAHHKEEVSVTDAVISRFIPFTTVSNVNRVILWISASRDDGSFVDDLTQEDVQLIENGKPQELLEFHREERPITLAILIDSSGSMRDKLEEVHDAAAGFVDTLLLRRLPKLAHPTQSLLGNKHLRGDAKKYFLQLQPMLGRDPHLNRRIVKPENTGKDL